MGGELTEPGVPGYEPNPSPPAGTVGPETGEARPGDPAELNLVRAVRFGKRHDFESGEGNSLILQSCLPAEAAKKACVLQLPNQMSPRKGVSLSPFVVWGCCCVSLAGWPGGVQFHPTQR